MKGLQKEYSPWAALSWCALVVGWFILLMSWMPPIIAAAGYTLFSIVLYRICYGTYTKLLPNNTDFQNLVFAFVCAALWPLYFLFGVFFFLDRAIRRE